MTRGRTGSGQCPKKPDPNIQLLNEIHIIASFGLIEDKARCSLERIVELIKKKETK
jgi:hypothetical protein